MGRGDFADHRKDSKFNKNHERVRLREMNYFLSGSGKKSYKNACTDNGTVYHFPAHTRLSILPVPLMICIVYKHL